MPEETPDQSRALALLAHRYAPAYDNSFYDKGWGDITDEQRQWAQQAFLREYGRRMEEPQRD